MHREHDHDEDGGAAGAMRAQAPAHIGHNGHRNSVQWQTPHLVEKQQPAAEKPDLDRVEKAFVEAFPQASDPVSLLRLAGILLSGRNPAGDELHLLRVEIEDLTDVGALSPLLGGVGFRYDALSGHMVSRRRRLRFVYFDGAETRRLTLAEARALEACA